MSAAGSARLSRFLCSTIEQVFLYPGSTQCQHWECISREPHTLSLTSSSSPSSIPSGNQPTWDVNALVFMSCTFHMCQSSATHECHQAQPSSTFTFMLLQPLWLRCMVSSSIANQISSISLLQRANYRFKGCLCSRVSVPLCFVYVCFF